MHISREQEGLQITAQHLLFRDLSIHITPIRDIYIVSEEIVVASTQSPYVVQELQSRFRGNF